jgi:hypothetical protein
MVHVKDGRVLLGSMRGLVQPMETIGVIIKAAKMLAEAVRVL